MKRFVLFIAAVLLAGCSMNNSPVAPPDVIYNVTGGEALFKVSLKGHPFVLDSNISGVGIGCHYNIPFVLNRDSIFCIQFLDNRITLYKNAPADNNDSLLQKFISYCGGVVKVEILDSLMQGLLRYHVFDYCQFDNDTIKVGVSCTYNTGADTTNIVQRMKAGTEDSWFTFKVLKVING